MKTYLDLYLQGDDTSISQGSFMRTQYLFVLMHIRNKGEVGSKAVLLLWILFVIYVLCLLFFAALWSPAGNGLSSWPSSI